MPRAFYARWPPQREHCGRAGATFCLILGLFQAKNGVFCYFGSFRPHPCAAVCTSGAFVMLRDFCARWPPERQHCAGATFCLILGAPARAPGEYPCRGYGYGVTWGD